jgi:FkbM family methyltransferase
MFAKILARMAAALPSSVKYKLNWAKGIYTLVMSLGQDVIEICTAAGSFHWRIDKLTSQHDYILATYEPYMQEAFLQWVHKGSVVYDIGAHVGFHSLFCGLLVGSSGLVLAFEPGPEARASLEHQIAANPGVPVRVLTYAISDRCGTVWLDISRDSKQYRISDCGSVAVEARTIDSLVMGGIPSRT